MNNNDLNKNLPVQVEQAIPLTKNAEESLRNFDDIKENSQEMSLFEQSDEFSSSYAEAFPILHKEEEESRKGEIFSTVSQIAKNKDLTQILEETGLTKGINLISQNPKLISDIGESKLDEIKGKMAILMNNSYDLSNLKNRISTLESENKITLNNIFKTSDRAMDFIERNKEIVSAGFTFGSLITPILAYRVVMKLFIAGAFPSGKYNKSTISERQMRPKTVRAFALLGAPAIVGMLIAVGLPQKVLNINITVPPVSDPLANSSLLFYILGLTKDNKFLKWIPNWIKTLLVYFIILIFAKVIFSIIFYLSPNLWEWILSLTLADLKYPWLIWNSIFIIKVIIELILFNLFSNNKISVNKNLPKFMINNLTLIQTVSQTESKARAYYKEIFIRQVLIYLFIFFISILFFALV